jgi:hypothetical protein
MVGEAILFIFKFLYLHSYQERIHLDMKVIRCVGDHQTKIRGSPNYNCTKLGKRIPCTYRCIQFGGRGYVGTKSKGKNFPWVVPLGTTLPKTQESWTKFLK